MLPNATRVVRKAMAATEAVLDRRVINIGEAPLWCMASNLLSLRRPGRCSDRLEAEHVEAVHPADREWCDETPRLLDPLAMCWIATTNFFDRMERDEIT